MVRREIYEDKNLKFDNKEILGGDLRKGYCEDICVGVIYFRRDF